MIGWNLVDGASGEHADADGMFARFFSARLVCEAHRVDIDGMTGFC